ncbi:MAG: HDOD domain-containing protein [Verrucomicrobiota bacterium]
MQTYKQENPYGEKAWVNRRLEAAFESEHMVPALSRAATRLSTLVNDPNVELGQIIEVISLDSGLVARFLKAASTAAAGGYKLSSIEEAVLRLGLKEIRRISLTVGVMGHFSHLRVKVNWNQFWLHSILVARLTEKLAAGFRPPTGHEYLAGLVHDLGKLVIEHCFPREVESISGRATERECADHELEDELLGTNHARIGAVICEHLQLQPQIISAVRYHHAPEAQQQAEEADSDGGFLAACIAVASVMANRANINGEGTKTSCSMNPEALPEWQFLSRFELAYGLDIDTEQEVAMAQADMQGLC